MLYSVNLAQKETFFSQYAQEEMVDLLGGTFGVPVSYRCSIVPVDPGYEARTDLISKDVYGDDISADLIVKINGPSDPFEVNEGQYIALPSPGDTDRFIGTPEKAFSEAAITAASSRPKAKAKRDKRKPNEAVLGDSRFNIDIQSSVVVY